MTFQQDKSNFSADRDLSYQALNRVLDSALGRLAPRNSDERDDCFDEWQLVSIQKATQIARRGSDGNYRILWTKELEEANTIKVRLPGINQNFMVISPKKINSTFPPRFKMEFHPSWQKLRNLLYDPRNVDYTHRQLFSIQRDNAVLCEKIGVNFEMPNGYSIGAWEGDAVSDGDDEHHDFWVEDNADYELWVAWSNAFDKAAKHELLSLLQDEMTERTYQKKPPTMEESVQKLVKRLAKKFGY